MTVKELRKALKGLDPHMDVVIEKEDGEFTLQMLMTAKVRNCTFSEEGGGLKAKAKCLVLSDEL